MTNLFLFFFFLECYGDVADFVFVLDSSSSIWPPDYNRLRSFVNNFAKNYDIGQGPCQIKMGVVSYSDKAHVDIPLDKYNDRLAVSEAIKNVPYRMGQTNTADALDLTKKMFERPYPQPERPQVAIIVTDGVSDNREETRRKAQKLKDAGIHTYSVGVGNNVDLQELVDIASTYPKGIVRVPSYKALEQIAISFNVRK